MTSLYRQLSAQENWGNCKLSHDCRRVCSHRRRRRDKRSFVASASAVCIGHNCSLIRRLVQQLSTRKDIFQNAVFLPSTINDFVRNFVQIFKFSPKMATANALASCKANTASHHGSVLTVKATGLTALEARNIHWTAQDRACGGRSPMLPQNLQCWVFDESKRNAMSV